MSLSRRSLRRPGRSRTGERWGNAQRGRADGAWRRQARRWLRADLAQWARTLDSGSELDRNLAKKMLMRWRVEPDLAGLLESNESDELSADERKDDLELWRDIDVALKRIARQERAVALDPKQAHPAKESPILLIREGRLNDARVAWQTALEANPLDHNDWHGYAELCLFLGREDEYRRARQDLLARFVTTTNPYFAGAHRPGVSAPARIRGGAPPGRGPRRPRRGRRPVEQLMGSPLHPVCPGPGGIPSGAARSGDLRAARGRPRGAGAARRLVLAMALHRSGQLAGARKTLAATVLTYDWRARQALDQDGWTCHVLRREAEGMILPNLPAFLDGKYQPQDDDERLALLAAQLATWEFRGLPGATGGIEANGQQQVAAWERAIAEYGKLVTELPAKGTLLIKLAAVYQSAGRTREAVPLLATASAANPKDTLLSLKVAALQAWFGQDREFAATRQRILAFAKDTNEATTAERAAKACSIVPVHRQGGTRSGAGARPHRGEGRQGFRVVGLVPAGARHGGIPQWQLRRRRGGAARRREGRAEQPLRDGHIPRSSVR